MLYTLMEFHESGILLVICTGQTLENIKGFLIQGLGNELVYSGDLSVIYESRPGMFTSGHGLDTKHLLYKVLDADVSTVFETVRE